MKTFITIILLITTCNSANAFILKGCWQAKLQGSTGTKDMSIFSYSAGLNKEATIKFFEDGDFDMADGCVESKLSLSNIFKSTVKCNDGTNFRVEYKGYNKAVLIEHDWSNGRPGDRYDAVRLKPHVCKALFNRAL